MLKTKLSLPYQILQQILSVKQAAQSWWFVFIRSGKRILQIYSTWIVDTDDLAPDENV